MTTPNDAARELFAFAEFVDKARNADSPVDDTELAAAVKTFAIEDRGPDPDDLAEWLWLLDAEFARYLRIIRGVRKAIDRIRTQDIIDHGPIRLGESAYYTGKAGGWKILDGQGDALLDWLDTADNIRAVFRCDAGNLRKTALEAVAAQRADGDADVAAAVLDTFLQWTPSGDVGDQELKEVPARDRAWAKKLNHRQRKG